MNYYIEVVLPLSLAKTFTYQISETEFNFIQVGMRVAVPFGKSKIYTALVLELHRYTPDLYEPKEIHEILDSYPIVNQIQIDHWKWISSYYMCAIGDVYRSALPSVFLLENETIFILNQSHSVETNLLSDDEFLIYQALQQQSSLKVGDVISILNKKSILPTIQKMIDGGILLLQDEVKEIYKPKVAKYIKLDEQFKGDIGLQNLLQQLKGEKQKKVVLAYFKVSSQNKLISLKDLLDVSEASTSVVKALVTKNVFEEYYLQHDRVNFNEEYKGSPSLSRQQSDAVVAIQNGFQKLPVALLHGVTSSGKTEVYIKLIEDYLKQDKQVLYLLPEIALTTQLVSRLVAYFGNRVAVFHSKYSNNERAEVWRNVLNNSDAAKIIIGARSALFLPFSNLSFIIVDEEHEQNFKQTDPAPRYHARDAALILAKLCNANVLLGSATPSLESYSNAESGKFTLVEMKQRFGNVKLPEIEIVDLKDKYFRKKMSGHFSDTLVESINDVLAQQQQVILFQNRRGYSPVVECGTCGHVPHCQQCDVSLTYHKHKNQLRCHYCGYTMGNPTNCHKCSSVELITKGFGTEQIQQELTELFPSAKIGRMDQDTTRGKFGFEKIIDSFRNREIDILVGTQMVAKGLDFDNVTLVGVMNADNLLYHPDFRALERAFQMLTQVAGRAGRSDTSGRVVIQTYNPSHATIQQVLNNAFDTMYVEQLHERKIYKYPPFYKMIKFTLKHRDYDKLNQGSLWLYEVMRQNLDIPVLGPEEPGISRIRNEYIKNIMVKIPRDKSLAGTKKTIRKILDSFESVAQFRSIKTTINVDFY